jgi:hypothetical protein
MYMYDLHASVKKRAKLGGQCTRERREGGWVGLENRLNRIDKRYPKF